MAFGEAVNAILDPLSVLAFEASVPYPCHLESRIWPKGGAGLWLKVCRLKVSCTLSICLSSLYSNILQ